MKERILGIEYTIEGMDTSEEGNAKSKKEKYPGKNIQESGTL